MPFLKAPDRFHCRRTVYPLVRCLNCDLVRLVEPPSPEEMGFHYGREYHHAIEHAAETDTSHRWKRQRNVVLDLVQQGSYLDLGCSSGAFLKTLRGDARRLYGIEISATEAEKARVTAKAEVFTGDPADAPYAANTFDVITGFHLLEHVYQPVELLQLVYRWLKPGGYLYIIVPNIASWEARIFQSHWYGLELPRHLFHFSPPSLEAVANRAKFRTVRLSTPAADSFSEHSFHYVFESLLARLGVSMNPLSAGAPAPITVKVLRKLFRLSAELPFRRLAGLSGRGACVEGIFQKPAAEHKLP